MASQEFNRVLQTTISEFMLGAEDQTLRNRKLLALMKAKGRISFSHSGTSHNWGVEYKERDLDGYADGDTLQFSRSDTIKRADLPWRGYTMNDMVTKKEKLMNSGKPALIKYVSELVESMSKNFTNRFHKQLYIDGDAAGNSKKMHGFDSFTTASVSAGNFIATPNDTYAGIVTNLGNYSGSWTGTWPTGSGDSDYDFWAPVIVDYTNTGWAAATKTWVNTAHEALRYGIIKCKKNDATTGMLDCVFLDGELYRQWETLLDAKERVLAMPGGANAKPTLRNLGWGDVQDFEGCEITWEFGVPADASGNPQGYGFNVDEMELLSLQDRLFMPEGPFYDEASLSDRFAIHMFGNTKFNPRYFSKWAQYS